VLARYTGVAPEALLLTVSERGKPRVAHAGAPHFSVTHSGGSALVAVAGRPVGVDLEREREPARLLYIARRVLHADTAAVLAALSPAQRRTAFLDAWTLREAHVKAVGGGLFETPDVLPFAAGQPLDGAVRPVRDRLGTVWSVARFAPAPRTRACLVVAGDIRRVRYFEWDLADAMRQGGGA
jgi:4'-phosphopantetheinyl transferase